MINLNRPTKNFSYTISIPASETVFYDFTDDTDTDDYAPFKNIVLLNWGSNSVQLYRNGEKQGKRVNSGTILELNMQQLSTIKIENLSGSSAAELTFEINNEYSNQELLKELLLAMVRR